MNSLHLMKLDLSSVLISVSSSFWLGIKMWTFYKANSSIFCAAGDAGLVLLIPWSTPHPPNTVTTTKLSPVLLSAIPAGNIPHGTFQGYSREYSSASGVVPEIKLAEFTPKKPLSSRAAPWTEVVTSPEGLGWGVTPGGANIHPSFLVSSWHPPLCAAPTGKGHWDSSPWRDGKQTIKELVRGYFPQPPTLSKYNVSMTFFAPKATSASVASHKLKEASWFCGFFFVGLVVF